MPKCFISYSYRYRDLLDPIRRLLQALGFEVEVLDGPDEQYPASPQAVKNADCIVILYGPAGQPKPNQQNVPVAERPRDEASYALAQGKPFTLILHRGTSLPSAFHD